MRYFLMLVLILSVCACSDLEPVEVEAYFDVDSVVNVQYENLKSSHFQIRKVASVNGRSDTSYLEPEDSTRWDYELGVFRKANINKPVLRGAYEVERKELPDGHSITYIPKDPDERTVKYLEVRFAGEALSEIHARISDSNPIYNSERTLVMYFDSDQNRLKHYEIDGVQKMILKDTVSLTVASEILYDMK